MRHGVLVEFGQMYRNPIVLLFVATVRQLFIAVITAGFVCFVEEKDCPNSAAYQAQISTLLCSVSLLMT